MLWIYAGLLVVDGILPILLKSCPLYWTLGIVMLILEFFSERIPCVVKWMLATVLTSIGAYSVLLYISSTYATVAYPFLIVQSVLVIVLVVMTPTKPRRKKVEALFS